MCRKDLPDYFQAKVNRMFPYQGPIPAKNPYTFAPINPSDTSGEVSTPEGRVSLPPDWPGSGTLTFAMAGARSSGKSLYIAVVVKLLQQLVVAHGAPSAQRMTTLRKHTAKSMSSPFLKKWVCWALHRPQTPRMLTKSGH